MEASWFKSGRYRGLLGEMPVVVCLSLGGRDVADGLQQSVVIEPGHPFERREFQGLLRLPGAPGDGSIRPCRGWGIMTVQLLGFQFKVGAIHSFSNLLNSADL